MKILYTILLILAALIFLGWLGLQFKPAAFPRYEAQTTITKTIPIPDNLPAPVERFYRAAYGETIPVVESAVIQGRAIIRPFFNIPLPARFLFVHNAGKDYRHYIEATWFGLPIMKVNEGYVDGASFFEAPVGNIHDDASTNQAANLAVWAEAGWFPSIWLTDPRVRWEAVDDRTALLFVPFEDRMENFIVRFNPETGMIDTMEAMRYRDSGDAARKILWITTTEKGPNIEGSHISSVGSATWLDQGKPWATFSLEEVHFNVDVSEYIYQRGR
ncbi:MAG TPA: DUF6544 family protein [Anaerolineales bacterium]|nr:DUF6544 family protein [Anaerolineales bacterium]